MHYQGSLVKSSGAGSSENTDRHAARYHLENPGQACRFCCKHRYRECLSTVLSAQSHKHEQAAAYMVCINDRSVCIPHCGELWIEGSQTVSSLR